MQDLLNLVYSFRAKEIDLNGFIGGLGQWFNDIGVGGPVMSVVNASWFPFQTERYLQSSFWKKSDTKAKSKGDPGTEART